MRPTLHACSSRRAADRTETPRNLVLIRNCHASDLGSVLIRRRRVSRDATAVRGGHRNLVPGARRVKTPCGGLRGVGRRVIANTARTGMAYADRLRTGPAGSAVVPSPRPCRNSNFSHASRLHKSVQFRSKITQPDTMKRADRHSGDGSLRSRSGLACIAPRTFTADS